MRIRASLRSADRTAGASENSGGGVCGVEYQWYLREPPIGNPDFHQI